MLSVLYIVILVTGLVVAAVWALGLWPRGQRRSATLDTSGTTGRPLRLLPIAMGSGAAVFGAVGLALTYWRNVEPELSVIWALAVGLLVGFAVLTLLYFRMLRRMAGPTGPGD